MAARIYSRRRYSSSPRRKKIWARRMIVQSELQPGETQHSLLLWDFEEMYGAQLIGCTVARIRGFIEVVGTPPGGLIYGIRVVTARTVDDIPQGLGPGSEPHADWMTWDVVSVQEPFYRFDVKAMRKFEELGQQLVLSVESAGTNPVTWTAGVSVLVLLP